MSSKRNRILFVGNGSSLNRGCEAITRGTRKIIQRTLGDSEFISVDHGNTPHLPPVAPDIDQYSISVSRWSRAWFVQNTMRVLRLKKTWFPVLGRYIHDVDAVLALGGDNYSMDYGSLRVHLAHIDYARLKNKPFVIWGGSVGPFNKRGKGYENYVAGKLKEVTAILAREDVSVEYLDSIGVRDNVRRVTDPAFIMEPVEPPKKKMPFVIPPKAIGFNFSSLMARYMTGGDIPACIQLVATIIQKVLDEFNIPIVLVPHSQKAPSDDYLFLNKVHQAIVTKGAPVYLLPRNLNAAELKWVISQMACFAGARMHSTIASLSSAVPTLSFSYSIKSIGLNCDVFGHEEHLLSPKVIIPTTVVEKIGVLLRNEKEIRQHLEDRLPEIKEKAYLAGIYLRSVLQNGSL